MYWSSTSEELHLLMDAVADRNKQQAKADILNHGLVASTIINVQPVPKGRSRKLVKPEDFLPREHRKVSAEEFTARMRGWVQIHNQSVKA